MASGLPEKMSVTMVLAAIRRLQQRDCPGFSPDSLLITTHKSGEALHAPRTFAPTAARCGSEPIAGAKVQYFFDISVNFIAFLFGSLHFSSYFCRKIKLHIIIYGNS